MSDGPPQGARPSGRPSSRDTRDVPDAPDAFDTHVQLDRRAASRAAEAGAPTASGAPARAADTFDPLDAALLPTRSPLAIVEWDAALRVARWSEEAQYLFGWTEAEAKGRDAAELRLVVEPDAPHVAAVMSGMRGGSAAPAARVLRTQEPIFTPVMGTGSLAPAAPDARYVELIAQLDLASGITVPLVARGRSLGVIVFALVASTGRHFDDADFVAARAFAERAALALDTTRLLAEARVARAEAEAARALAESASRAKGDFLAVMSHELRTPLNAIGGYAELMELGVRGPITAEQGEDLRRIQKSQRHLLGLINQVLSFSHVESGALSYEMTDVALDEALRNTEALVAPQMRAKGIAYSYTPCEAAVAVHADAGKLRQVVLNLLSNAVKFTERGGRVEVACDLGPELVAVRVRDSGRGIAGEQLAAIFEPFVQVERSLTSVPEGVGLGLSIGRQLARGMGGDLTVESALGAGSTFTLTLRRA